MVLLFFAALWSFNSYAAAVQLEKELIEATSATNTYSFNTKG